MNDQERQLLQTFLQQLVQVRGTEKDPQAEQLIQQAVAEQPDAHYLLVQRALLVDQALQTAKAQIASLQQQLQAARGGAAASGAPGSSSFLGSATTWGNHPETSSVAPARPVGRVGSGPAPAGYPSQAGQGMAGYPPPGYGGAPASGGFLGGRGGSLLGTMAATAAGVAGGAFLFQGIENMMGHHGNNAASGFLNEPGMAPSADGSAGHDQDAGAALADSSTADADYATSDTSDASDAGTDSVVDESLMDDSLFSDSGDAGYDTGGDDSSLV